ncbi:Predicted arabinose efflux permease, MFS family [Saccharopolyspora antimicrobica]|uniref:MFS family arabinose efflux permease n=1 Tax=Saccharopolyspora antimicrobica TaxID=455193 RepID=A0A1I5C2R9_9PSEU|nr:MFS transporter [Saccharopolyspora antimicrobica]RKT88996.1 putative MFS family arabinose efflux permease [Saccharopolyspora antimicrobica]SFN81092.1 Predicted arabinose efflux permease, MFS family [Saccharopolyspora antimicrobica]
MASSAAQQPPLRNAAPKVRQHTATGPGRGTVLLLSVAVGLCVASNYYAQPLLDTIARDLGMTAASASLVVTFAQVGYALGLVFLLPLGDLLERRRLVCGLTAATSISLVLTAIAPNGALLLAGAALTGLLSVTAQILVPFAADLASPHQRGRVVGTVMTGLVLGMLLARTASGALATIGGWRTVYWVAALAMLVLTAVLHRSLPQFRGTAASSYPGLVRSTARLLVEEPVLRLRAVIGMLAFACFSVLWTSLAFLLSGPGHGWSEGEIGLIGLFGAAGAIAAQLAGRLADRGLTTLTTIVGAVALLASWGLLLLGAHSLVLLIAGIVLLDLAHQGVHITNQSLIYALRPDARGRITSAYMTCYFAGGAIGSALAAVVHARAGWTGVCALGAVLAGALCLIWAASAAKVPRAGRELWAVASAVFMGAGSLALIAVVLRLAS